MIKRATEELRNRDPAEELSKKEIAQLIEMKEDAELFEVYWNLFDLSGDGKVTVAELNRVLTILLQGNAEDKLRVLWLLHDRKETGSIGRTEVFESMRTSADVNNFKLSVTKLNALVDCLFRVMDPNNTGKITFQSFRKYILTNRKRDVENLTIDRSKRYIRSRSIENLNAASRNSQLATNPSLASTATATATATASMYDDSERANDYRKLHLILGQQHLLPHSNRKRSDSDEEIHQKADAASNRGTLHRVLNSLRIESVKRLIYAIYAILCCVFFTFRFFMYYDTPVFHAVGYSVPIAKGFSAVINLNCALLLIPVSRILLTWLRGAPMLGRVLPFDKNISFHRAFAIVMLLSAIGHTVAHTVTFIRLESATPQAVNTLLGKQYFTTVEQLKAWYWFFATLPGLTGLLMFVCLIFIMGLSIAKRFRNRHFNTFYYSHHLFVVFYVLLFAHPAIMMMGLPLVWPIVGLPLLWYAVERIIRWVRGAKRWPALRADISSGRVVHLEIEKPFNYKAGQYVRLMCPAVSRIERHPFTITSSPQQPTLTLNIQSAGDWTQSFLNLVEQRNAANNDVENKGWFATASSAPKKQKNTKTEDLFVSVDGPYGAASEAVFDFKITVLIGAGIGATPFASVLRDVLIQLQRQRSGALPTLTHTTSNNIEMETINIEVHSPHAAPPQPQPQSPDRPSDQPQPSASQPDKHSLEHVYFFWLNSNPHRFEWFREELVDIANNDVDNFIDINTFLTSATMKSDLRSFLLWVALDIYYEQTRKDMITELPTRTLWGRPHFPSILDTLAARHPGERIGVFFCGPMSLSTELYTLCRDKSYIPPHRTKFKFFNENF